MPTSQEEWEAHWAFYKLTLAQRDAAWREIATLRAQMFHRMRSLDSAIKTTLGLGRGPGG
jgi:hypothetical protein